MNKNEVLKNLTESRQQFMQAIEGLSEADLQQPGVVEAWSIKDVMSHIISWEAELIKLLWDLEQGQKPRSVHFSGESDDAINARFYQESRDRPLERVQADFQAVRKQTIRRVETLTDRDLTDIKRVPVRPKGQPRPLFDWIAGNSFAHELEHTAQILNWRKQNSR